MKRIGLILIIAFFPTYSLCGNLDAYTQNYLQRIQNKNATVAFCLCSSKTNSQYSAALVIEIGTKKGLLIEKNGQAVVGLATLSITSKGFRVEDFHGEGYGRDRVNKLVKELSGKQFQLLTPMRINQFEGKKAWDAYTNAPPLISKSGE